MVHKMQTQNLIVEIPSRQAGSESSRSPPARERDPYLASLEFIDKKAVTLNDFWLYEDSFEVSTTSLSTENLSIKLMDKREHNHSNSRKFLGGLRIVVLETTDESLRRVPISESAFQDILSSFRIPSLFGEVLSKEDRVFMGFTSDEGDWQGCLQRSFLIPNYGLAVTHDNSSRLSYAVLLTSSYGGDPRNRYQRLLEDIKDHKEMVLCPLLMPALILALSTERSIQMVSRVNQNLKNLENTTGHTPFRREEDVEIGENDLPRLRLDASKNRGICDIHFTLTKSRQLHLEKSLKLLMSLAEVEKQRNDTASIRALRNTERFIVYLQTKNENLLGNIELARARVGTQLAAIDQERNITIAAAARRDGAVMREISVATKRDSLAMKILASITILFLPGTFFGTLLGNPLSHWQVYTGLTVGVTLMTAAGACYWLYVYEPRQKKREYRAAHGEV